MIIVYDKNGSQVLSKFYVILNSNNYIVTLLSKIMFSLYFIHDLRIYLAIIEFSFDYIFNPFLTNLLLNLYLGKCWRCCFIASFSLILTFPLFASFLDCWFLEGGSHIKLIAPSECCFFLRHSSWWAWWIFSNRHGVHG